MNNDSTSEKNIFSRLLHRLKHDRGAVLVEAAIAIPMLLLVILGATEAGLGWEAKSSTVSGVRTGVLRASTIGDRPETDIRVLQSIIGEVGADNVDRIEWIRIFEASGDPDVKFQTCAADPGGFPGCVVYDASFINEVVTTPDAALFQQTRFDQGIGGSSPDPTTGRFTAYTCASGAIDENWCASSRTIGGDTQFGVAISYKHEWFTGIFPFDSPTFQEYVISSTFASGGTNIASGSGTGLPGPFAGGTVVPTIDFDDPTDLADPAGVIGATSGVNASTDFNTCLLYTSPSPRDLSTSRMPSSA